MRIPSWLLLFLTAIGLASCIGHESDFVRSLAASGSPAQLVLLNGKILTVDKTFSVKEALAIRSGRFVAVGSNRDARARIGPGTRVIDLGGRTVIPGLIDSHIHATVAGLTWDLELRWESTRSLADGLKQIAAATQNKQAGNWIVVGGGWSVAQFPERRLPTRGELDALAPNHPVYVQYLRQAAVLNSAALKAAGIDRRTPDPPGGKFERHPGTGEPTGVLMGAPAWEYAHHKIPRPTLDRVRESIRNCFRELNRHGITSIGDFQTAGVTFAHRRLLAQMAQTGELTLRVNYYVSPNEPGDELEQLRRGGEEIKQLNHNDMFRFAGFGETMIRGTSDGLSNPEGIQIDPDAREKFRRLARFFADNGYNFHLHTVRDNTARQLLDILEEVNRVAPFFRHRIAFMHLEDATPETIARIKKLGGGISVQGPAALTGELNFGERQKTRSTPPLRALLESGVPLGVGSDAFVSSNYSPFLALWWLVTGKSIAGPPIRDRSQNLTRQEALRLYTIGSAWFTFDLDRKGSIEVDKLADLAVLDADYLSVPEARIRDLESVLTLVGGRVVHAAGSFAHLLQQP